MRINSSDFLIMKENFYTMGFSEMKQIVSGKKNSFGSADPKKSKICLGYQILSIAALHFVFISAFLIFYKINSQPLGMIQKALLMVISFAFFVMTLWICMGEHKLILLNVDTSCLNNEKLKKIEKNICRVCMAFFVLFFIVSVSLHFVFSGVDEKTLFSVISEKNYYLILEIRRTYYQVLTVLLFISFYCLILFSVRFKQDVFKSLYILYGILASSSILDALFSTLSAGYSEINISILISFVPLLGYWLLKRGISCLYLKLEKLSNEQYNR